MAIKRRSKINASFSMSSMTDIVFLLLIFFMITSTLISPNALKMILPQSKNQTRANKPIVSVSITYDLRYAVGTQEVPFAMLESKLKNEVEKINTNNEIPTISLHADKRVAWEEVVKVMNIAKRNKYKLIAATTGS
jgi:biopolymer transport protein ExbD